MPDARSTEYHTGGEDIRDWEANRPQLLATETHPVVDTTRRETHPTLCQQCITKTPWLRFMYLTTGPAQ
jgi:hypothetical protein